MKKMTKKPAETEDGVLLLLGRIEGSLRFLGAIETSLRGIATDLSDLAQLPDAIASLRADVAPIISRQIPREREDEYKRDMGILSQSIKVLHLDERSLQFLHEIGADTLRSLMEFYPSVAASMKALHPKGFEKLTAELKRFGMLNVAGIREMIRLGRVP